MKWLCFSFSSDQVSPKAVHGPGYKFDRLIRLRDAVLKPTLGIKGLVSKLPVELVAYPN